MEISTSIDLEQVAKELGLPAAKVEAAVELLDDGNTVPFITRYRKDQTGGLDEEQIREIQEKVVRLRTLADRKNAVLKTLETRGKLTDKLAKLIAAADSLRRVEDIYLPFKAKKQTLADQARQRGLEPLADEVLRGDPATADLRQRAEHYVDAEKGVPGVDEALQGVRHIIAERFNESVELRDAVRRVFKESGKLVSTRLEEPAETAEDTQTEPTAAAEETEPENVEPESSDSASTEPASTEPEHSEPAGSATGHEGEPATTEDAASAGEQPSDSETATPPENAQAAEPSDAIAESPVQDEEKDEEKIDDSSSASEQHGGQNPPAEESAPEESAPEESAPEPATPASDQTERPAEATPSDAGSVAMQSPAAAPAESKQPAAAQKSSSKAAAKKLSVKQIAAQNRKEAKKKKRERKIASFKDYFQYEEALAKIPHHRLLAINRGDRTKILKVKVEADDAAMFQAAAAAAIPQDHPHAGFLESCLQDAMSRLIAPGVEREVRREMTDKAELHAVQVFVRNLRQLLLQPPVHQMRVLAVDPGFRSGCKVAALDEYGNVLGHTMIHVIGKADIVRKGRDQIVEMVRMYHIPVIAIGNGTACRESEKLIADILANELADTDVKYVIVNEAGASVYSTSSLGREELPGYDPVLRSAISIGRRLQDPLSELVKINPANIGVGLYQHDVKSKHLEQSLDSVVESCVNYVGVDVNTASPSLLRYISGMNQLTARRLYEHRQKHGPFRNREQFKQVPGFGEATFTQAAGFLKISNGDNPLDATWIHPESYEVARRVIEKLGGSEEELSTAAQQVEKVEKEEFAAALLGDLEDKTPDTSTSESPQQPDEVGGGSAVESQSAVASDGDQQSAEPTSAETASVETDGNVADAAGQEAPAAAELGGQQAESVDEPSPAAAPDTTSSATAETEDAAAAEAVATTEAASPTSPESPDAQLQDAVSAAEATSSQTAEQAATDPDHPQATVDASAAADVPHAETATVAAEDASERETSAASTTAQLQSSPGAEPPRKSNVLSERAAAADPEKLASELQVGSLLLSDILKSLTRPGRDPREDLPPPMFRRGVMKLEDLEPDMELSGTVLNVVDFGAFVDIGLSDSGLVHISRLADRFIRTPHEVVAVGDILTVWVVDVDKQRRRVSLTAIKPGTEKPKSDREAKPRDESRPRQRKKFDKKPTGGRREGGRGQRGRSGKPQHQQKQRPPAPVTPITKAMAEGNEPLRSFSDLMQFYEKKSEGDQGQGEKKKK